MFRKSGPLTAPSKGSSFRLAIGLSMSILLLSLAHSLLNMLGRLQADRVINGVVDGPIFGSPLFWDLVRYVLALLVLHVGFGTVLWGYAKLTEAVWPATKERGREILLLAFLVATAWLIMANAAWYPWSLSGSRYADFASFQVGPLTTFQWLTALVAMPIGLTLLRSAWILRDSGRLPTSRLSRAPVAIGVLLVGGWLAAQALPLSGKADYERPNVIIIGVDSMRPDRLSAFGGRGVAPNVEKLVAGAQVFPDTITPLAQTYAAWMSILTGRSPMSTGARYNLMPPAMVNNRPTLGHLMGEAGYRTVYGTDEVRFSNIDASYGFDAVVTPKIGASDFVLGSFNDMILPNVVANTWIAKVLFPNTYANRAAAVTYRGETFVDEMDDALDFDEPTFVAVHFTSSHWPYYDSSVPKNQVQARAGDSAVPLYDVGIMAADRSVGLFIEMLRRKGALDNAIVVVLSDHGEAFGQASDTLIKSGDDITGATRPIQITALDHGWSVLSPTQYQVVLAFRVFGANGAQDTGTVLHSQPASLEDIAPTIMDLIGSKGDPARFDGLSLAPLLRGGASIDDRWSGRVRFTETGVFIPPRVGGEVNPAAMAMAGMSFFTVDPNSGRVVLRQDKFSEALSYKEMAAIQGDWLLATLPNQGGSRDFVLVDRSSGKARVLQEAPSSDDAVARLLWDSLHDRYGAELRPPAG